LSAFIETLAGAKLTRGVAERGLAFYARKRTRELDALSLPKTQENVLRDLVRHARKTRFGREHHFDTIRSVEDYQKRVPIRTYEQFWDGYWKDAYPRLEGITWPDHIPYYALSSGTTSWATKYIPVSAQMLSSNRKAAFTTLALFKAEYPQASIFNGRVFFLGGNTDMRLQADGSLAGDLSGIAAREVVSAIRPYTFPPLELAAIPDWNKKVIALAEASATLPITAFSGVPAWMLVVFDALKKVTGKKTIAEIWPELRLIIHGGTMFDPYRELFQREIASDRVHTAETYPCSEGFVATEDCRTRQLRIVPDHGIFFEFVPFEELDKERPTRHTLATVETGVNYAVIMTTCAGLWSYLVGDTVSFIDRPQARIRFTGRTKYYLSAFGEHLISEEIEKAIVAAAEQTQASVKDFHVGPVFPTDPTKPGHHRYLVEFALEPTDRPLFMRVVDDTLRKINEDYDAHRAGDLSLLAPQLQVVRLGGYLDWMIAHGKRPPQHKVPRMDNTGKLTESMRVWFEGQGLLS
jgi:hypothetical protein